MRFRLFIAASHEEGHHIIRNEGLEYDHTRDRLLSTSGASPHHQLRGMVIDPQKVWLLGTWIAGINGTEWADALEAQLARTRHKLDECRTAG